MGRMCKDCGKKWANYGEQGNTKRKWCGTCAKKHGGLCLGKPKMCEDCELKQPSYGLEHEQKTRWCARCAAELHPEAQRLRGVAGARRGGAAGGGPRSTSTPPLGRSQPTA